MKHFQVRVAFASRGALLAALVGLFPAGAGCASEAIEEEPELVDAEAAADEQLAAKGKEFVDNDVVVAWNQIGFDAAIRFDGFNGFENLRAMSMMHLAAHDALNTIVPVYKTYAFSGATAGSHDDAHPTAAVAQASHDVLIDTYPDQQAILDGELEAWLASVPDGSRKTAGIALGQDAAAAIIANREGDGMDVVGEYTPGNQPGDYQFVPPFDFVFQPAFGESKPFGLKSGKQFRPGPPPALGSAAYAKDYNEVKAVGVINSTERTQDQTFYAQWWYENSEIGWNRVSNIVARERDLSLFRSARMFALVNMAMTDGYVAGWNAKQFYDFWRPYTAIRAGDTDGNAATDPDPSWESFLVNPPVQDYPSTHSVLGAAASSVLAAVFGTDNVPFTMQSTTADPANPIRSYQSLRAAADENADSRVRAGIHFRFATKAGLAQGRKIGPELVSRHLRPR
ncbi:MAG TPA: vanadium-dependent haloperoxidase [Kofleriaceae bacterium]|nr:vanadium-dependent haloperoxidase [Kofleriaceae bacterium]